MAEAEAPLPFGKYELHRRIAQGGMGEVFLASLHGELGFEKRLVVKTIRTDLAASSRFVEMFAAEAKTAVALSHGNIVPIYELGRCDDTLYIAMGHVDGPSLAQLLRAHRERAELPGIGLALFVTREVLTGLAYAHTPEPGRAAVVHRDVSPRNVLIERSGQVRIVDFGIALPARERVESFMGSIGYVAPEQARAEAADPSADVFSVACILYELITLERAFPRAEVWSPPDLATVPEELRGPLERALAVDPARRPADAGAFLRELAPAVRRHAATYGDHDLAQHLREAFPEGWEHPSAPGLESRTPATAATAATQTFATRLTALRPGPAPRPTRSGRIALAGTGAMVVVVTLTWLGTRPTVETAPSPDPPAEVEPVSPPPTAAPPRPTPGPADVDPSLAGAGAPTVAPAIAGEGSLTVLAPDVQWADVLVDGRKAGRTPMRKRELGAGPHRVEVVCPAPVCDPQRTLARGKVEIRDGNEARFEVRGGRLSPVK